MTVLLEDEIVDVRTHLRDRRAEETRERAAADQTLAEVRQLDPAQRFAPENVQRIDDAYRRSDELRDEIHNLESHLNRLLERTGNAPRPEDRPDPGQPQARRTFGDLVARSDQMEALRRSGILDTEGGRVNIDPIPACNRDQLRSLLRQRTTIDVSAGGALVPIDQQVYPPELIPVRAPMVLDLITMGDTDSDQVNWVLQTTRTNNAAPTAFGTAAPESAYAFTLEQASVRRVTHFVPATKDVLADQGQLRTLVDSELMEDLKLAAENQVVNGSGSGQNLPGILNTSGILTQAKGSDSHLDAVHKIITQIRLNLFRDPTAILIHPTDYEKIVLAKDANGNYLFRIGEPGSIWGLTPIVSPVIAAGTSLVGLYTKATMWLRAGATVTASDGYNDFFTKGMVAILAEMRAAFATKQPKAFGTVTGM